MKWLGRILLGVVLLLLGVYLFVRTPDSDPAAMRAKYGGAPSQFLALGNGFFLGVPCQIGSGGVEKIFELDLDADEKAMLEKSFASVKKSVEEVQL